MPQSHVVFGRNFKKKRECKDRNDYNMDDSTEIILFYSFSEVMGTRTPSSIVPDFLIPSPGFFLLRTIKDLTFWSYLQATYKFSTRHSHVRNIRSTF